ncbi:MAG TPA: hypothetical protein VFG25_00920 [Nitrosopumilaceae archaeon]|nr:hypothetical protein [Nitrosopumilaceae archaeon]
MIYRTKLNTLNKFEDMKRIILIVFFAFLLFPISSSFSQKTDQPSQYGITLTSFTPYNFKDSDGHTIIVGEIENLKNFPITQVKVWGGFYDDVNEQPLETAIGTTLLDVIPPLGKSPYMIKSPTPNAAITGVSVNLLGFTSASPKNQQLVVDSEITEIGEKIKISGTITNKATIDASQTKIHVAFFDAFKPPRILGIATIDLEEPLGANSSTDFEFNERFDSRSLGYKVFAESTNYYSNIHNAVISQYKALTKLATIHDVVIEDDDGNKLTDVSVGNRITIKSKVGIQYSEDQEIGEQPYRYYIQVKQSGEKAFVEFLGITEGSFSSAEVQFPSIKWTPQKTGLYFVETFVWDPNGIPLASKGPIILILVT